MLFIPFTVTTVNDIHTSPKLGWTEVHYIRSKAGGGGGGYNPLILYQYEHFSDPKVFFKFHSKLNLQNYSATYQ